MDKQEWWRRYLVRVNLSGEFVRIAGTTHPVYSINPSGDNRYGPAIYVSSGFDTAAAEVGSGNLAGKALFPVHSGEYWVFDQTQYCHDFPDERDRLMAPRESGGYDACRTLRQRIERDSECTVSGIMYESTKKPDGLDFAFWDPRNSEGLPSGFFGSPLPIDPGAGGGPNRKGGDLVNPDPF